VAPAAPPRFFPATAGKLDLGGCFVDATFTPAKTGAMELADRLIGNLAHDSDKPVANTGMGSSVEKSRSQRDATGGCQMGNPSIQKGVASREEELPRSTILSPGFSKSGAVLSSCDLVMLRDLAENTITALAGLFDLARLQGEAQAFSSRVRLVNGKMAPPNPAIVPEVVVGVFLVDSKRELGFAFHAF